MDIEDQRRFDSDTRYGSSDYEHTPPLYWPWLVIIGLSAVVSGVAVALMIG
jgi:hypothetical protein